ncbi:Aconitate hydratase mitochondrial [Pyrenophora tritici-repentis]|nr:Aconitate hydratase mitochondrial [Pyrenophora tritici-repentis]
MSEERRPRSRFDSDDNDRPIQAKKGIQHVEVPPIRSAPTPPAAVKSPSSNSAAAISNETYQQDGDFIKDIEINDLRNRYTLTKGATQKRIKDETGADVTTRGEYYPDKNMATATNPPLYLRITSTSKEGLDKAVEMIEEMMKEDLPNLVDERRFRRRDPENFERDEFGRRKWPEEKISVNLEPINGFNLRAQVVGRGGDNVKYIQQETGCKVQIKGRGSGFMEPNSGSESDEPMYLHIAGPRPEGVAYAKKLCEELLEKGGYGGHNGYAAQDTLMSPAAATPIADANAQAYDANATQAAWAAYYAQNPEADPYAAYGGYQAYMQQYAAYYAQSGYGQTHSPAPAPGAGAAAPPPPPPSDGYGSSPSRLTRLLPSLRQTSLQTRRCLATSHNPPTARNVDIASRTPPYAKLLSRLEEVRRVLGSSRQLTLAEKILYSHLESPEESLLSNTNGGRDVRGQANLKLKPDRVAMQDASAQMALLQFMSCGLPSTAVPASIHCDHLIVGEKGADTDLPQSITGNKEIFDFLESAAKKYGIEFWPPGAGIIHQSVLENYSAPGLMMLGTDSHSPNAGGLGAIVIGVGGADAVDALVDAPWELKAPKILGVKLTGELSGWASPKDVILKLAGHLTVRGGTGFIIEYFGPGVQTLSCTGMATICNMGAEVGATTSLFPFSPAHIPYLQATHRGPIAEAAAKIAQSPMQQNLLRPDPEAVYDKVIEINLSELEPHINGPFTPDLSTPLSKFKSVVEENGWPKTFGAGLIGSCTNSSYQDMTRSEEIVKQASAAGLKPRADFFITPGSEQIRATLERDDTLSTFTEAGGTRTDEVKKGESNAILTSYNRNFPGRNDGNRSTMNFLASPELITAMSYSGSTTFNPMTDSIPTPSGESFKFAPPKGSDLPSAGFADGNPDFMPTPGVPDPSVEVVVAPTSSRLALLDPFPAFPDSDFTGLRVLYKVKGQCTTDTISAAGPWLKYKGHLPNISENTLIGAVNAQTDEVNVAYDIDGKTSSIPELAKRWRDQGVEWLVVAEHNYGEGSAREHAALQPRYLGGRIILAKSFARIHETNLKKQGIVPLTFANEADYDLFAACDEVATRGLLDVLRSGGKGEVELVLKKKDGSEKFIKTKHTLSHDQCGFVLAGSALNLLARKGREMKEEVTRSAELTD